MLALYPMADHPARPLAALKHCPLGDNDVPVNRADANWLQWTKQGQMPLCCPSMLTGFVPEKPNHRTARSVARYAKAYHSADMIDLRYAWHQKDERDRKDLGLLDPLPAPEGFREQIFKIGTEW